MLDHACTKFICAKLVTGGKIRWPKGNAQENDAIYINALWFFHKLSNSVLCSSLTYSRNVSCYMKYLPIFLEMGVCKYTSRDFHNCKCGH